MEFTQPLIIKQEVLKVATINTHESSIIHSYGITVMIIDCIATPMLWFPSLGC